MLSVSALECARGERRLFSGLSFTVAPHSLLEIRGANGSGKTTLLRALCGLLAPAAGRITWNDAGIHGVREEYHACIAYLGHLNSVKDELTALENVQCAAQLAGLAASSVDALAALHAFGIESARPLPCKLLSQGQRRRVALARLQLSGARPLWILDEPFSALDAAAIQLTQTLLESHLERGGMAVISTHQDVALRARSAQRIDLREYAGTVSRQSPPGAPLRRGENGAPEQWPEPAQ